jgi:urate oxidase
MLRTATVLVRIDRGSPPVVVSGFKGLVVLKTTQSGFSGFPRDVYTLLPETTER